MITIIIAFILFVVFSLIFVLVLTFKNFIIGLTEPQHEATSFLARAKKLLGWHPYFLEDKPAVVPVRFEANPRLSTLANARYWWRECSRTRPRPQPQPRFLPDASLLLALAIAGQFGFNSSTSSKLLNPSCSRIHR